MIYTFVAMLLKMIYLKMTYTHEYRYKPFTRLRLKNENSILDLWSFTEKAMQIQQIIKLS